jgi:hypothetical protein
MLVGLAGVSLMLSVCATVQIAPAQTGSGELEDAPARFDVIAAGDVIDATRFPVMKAGTFRRNGVPSSDQTTMTARLFRHGDILTMTARMEDPIYLAEPLYMTRTFQGSSAQPVLSVGNPCIPANEGVPEGAVPHYLPGENPFRNDMMRMYNVPAEAALGGPETMYPEYRKKLKDRYVPPAQCKRDCGGPGGFPLRTN